MKKYNCIVVFNKDKSKLLFCKRTEEPYLNLYNFVGGKVEKGEDSINAAYRELREETGIICEDISLYRLMDITYYQQEFVLELFVGKLVRDVELKEEKNPLVWFSIDEDFANMERFAGEQNIAHIVNVAIKYPLKERTTKEPIEKLCKDTLCIGVDGCRGGWIAAVIEQGRLRVEKFFTVRDIVERYERFDEFVIDMVIGLPSNLSHVRPDTIARTLIPGRTSTIFAVPSRQAVYADSEQEQIQRNEEVLGKGLAKQTMAIIPKMRELDSFLNREIKYKNVIKESHPEVCFARLNHAVVMSKKSDREGRTERIQILNHFLPDLTERYVLESAKRYDCNADDIVDAICLAVTGNLNLQGCGETIPKNPMTDEKGILMQMVIPKI